MTADTTNFLNWNKALFNYFFPPELEDDEEVSLFVDRETINEIGQHSGIGGYEELQHYVLLPIEERKRIYTELRQLYGIRGNLSPAQNRIFRSENLFDFATIYIDNAFYSSFNYPLYLIYLVFAIIMGCECYRLERNDIGGYMTERLRETFPKHNERRVSLSFLFNALAHKYPHFQARRLTTQEYIGLIKYQLVLSKAQENSLKKAMYSADLSDDLPYDIWAMRLRDYTEAEVRTLLNLSLHNSIYRHRFSSLRSSFDPVLYEQKHQNENFISHGRFALAIYEDDYSEENDKLVLLTDINNKTIKGEHLVIKRGGIDRLGEFAQYNIHHVMIDNDDRAEMKRYTLHSPDGDIISSEYLGNIVTFSRNTSNYLIQTKYPQRGKETYILVRTNCEEEWETWLHDHGNPAFRAEVNRDRIDNIFGEGWQLFYSSEIEYVPAMNNTVVPGSSITMDGGIRCIGMDKVYLINALPYFVFPRPIPIDRLSIFVNINNTLLDNNNYAIKVIDGNKLVIDFPGLDILDYSQEVSVTLEYFDDDNRQLSFHEDFSITDQDVRFNEEDLFQIDMWGRIIDNCENVPFMKGFQLYNSNINSPLPHNKVQYQNLEWRERHDIDIYDKRFFLVNLFASICSMRKSFSATEKQLEKCIRYAATEFDIDISKERSFFRSIRYMLINSGYINADFERRIYQPIPPSFAETPMKMHPGTRLYMLSGSYTKKFLYDLKTFCRDNKIQVFLHSVDNSADAASSLIPPVILLDHRFNPEEFKKHTSSDFILLPRTDVAVNIFRVLPTYNDYEDTLRPISTDAFNPRQLTEPEPKSSSFPRVRESRMTGFGAFKCVEMTDNHFQQITIRDIAWAHLYCQYKREHLLCIKDGNCLLFPINMDLPVMMQRALYLTNPGLPRIEKVFICSDDKESNHYYSIIKRYEIRDSTVSTRIPPVIEAITGREYNDDNPSIRRVSWCRDYRLFLWKNKHRQSNNPRSLLVMMDRVCYSTYGFAVLRGNDMNIYFNVGTDRDIFKLVDGNDVNDIFSKFMKSTGTWGEIGVSFKDEYAELPPKKEYQEEEIIII